jgi:fermentation-respiration switch protein FrsA (DUF1100 family)
VSHELFRMSAMPWRVAAVALAGFGVFAGGLVATQRSIIYQAGSEAPDLARSAIDGFEEITVTTSDGLDLIAWYLPARDGKPVIVMTHGNAGNIGHRTGKLQPIAEAGYGLFLVEYRGYAGNPGKPDEEGLYSDARAALAWLADKGIKGTDTVLYGESLGTGVAVAMAAEVESAALILETPFTSLSELAGNLYWYMPMAEHAIFDKYPSDERIADIDMPVLMLHGERDTTIPERFAKALFEKAVEPKELWLTPEAGHNNLYDYGAADVVLTFLDTHLGKSEPL